jgi:hypothetical protein
MINKGCILTNFHKYFDRTITIIKFWTSNFCHIKKITLNHALFEYFLGKSDIHIFKIDTIKIEVINT